MIDIPNNTLLLENSRLFDRDVILKKRIFMAMYAQLLSHAHIRAYLDAHLSTLIHVCWNGLVWNLN